MTRACAACGKKFPKKTHPRRKYCDDRCKRRFHRGARATQEKPAATPAASSVEDEGREGIQSTEAATMLALAAATKLGTPGGQAALVLARRIDASHRDTGASLASMVKRLQETIEALTADVRDDDDPVDELQRRREEKLRAAAAG